jgi:hypothetical protein
MRRSLLGLIALALALSACDSGNEEPPPSGTAITVLVAYTPGVRAAVADVEALVAQAFDEANAVYANSGIDLSLVPVHLAEVAYAWTDDRLVDLERLLRTDDGVLDEVHTLRDRHEADLVVVVSDRPGTTVNAAIMAEASTAFVIVYWEALGAPGYALAHEVGHLQGARHASDEDPLLAPFPYGHGFRTDSLRTIMAGGRDRRLVPVFSGPTQTSDGVVLGDSALHDNARVLRETAVYLSNFRGPQTPTDFVPPGTWPVLPDLR